MTEREAWIAAARVANREGLHGRKLLDVGVIPPATVTQDYSFYVDTADSWLATYSE